MPKMPLVGTIERIVMDKLIEAGARGVDHFDFIDHQISEERLAEVIENLKNGMFESENDDEIIFNS